MIDALAGKMTAGENGYIPRSQLVHRAPARSGGLLGAFRGQILKTNPWAAR